MANTNYIADNTKEMKKYISVATEGSIRELNNRLGPIVNPIWVPISLVYALVAHGYEVYEHAITDPEKKVRLTTKNWDDHNLYPENAKIQDPAIPEGSFLVSFKDDVTGNEMITTTGNIYVEILD